MKKLIIASMSILLPVFAQASTVCTETMINGRAVQRCVTGTKPYTAPTQPPAINTPQFLPILIYPVPMAPSLLMAPAPTLTFL